MSPTECAGRTLSEIAQSRTGGYRQENIRDFAVAIRFR
jgi:hypothetical protein